MRAQRLGSSRPSDLDAEAGLRRRRRRCRRGRRRPRRGRRLRAGARRRVARARAHVGLEPRPHLGLDRIHRVRGAHEQRVEVRPAPGQVGDHLGHPHLADQLARGRIDPHAARRRAPDIAARIALHAVGQAALALRDDAAGEHAPVHQRAVGGDVEHADQGLHRVVDVEALLVGREAQPIRLVEHVALHQQFGRPAARRHAVHALEAELPRPLHPVHRHAPVPGIGEVDRAVGFHHDVVGAVELVAVEMRSEHVALPVGALAHQARGGVLAHDEVQLLVVGHAVALVGRALDLAHAAALVPAPAHVGRHVGEQQVVLDRVPDRPFGKREAGPDLADRRPAVDQLLELALDHHVRHLRAPCSALKPGTSCAAPATASAARAPGPAGGRRSGCPPPWRGGRARAAGTSPGSAAS